MSNGGPKRSTSSTFHFFAGLGSGFTSAVLLQPADLLKTRIQQEQQHLQQHHEQQRRDGARHVNSSAPRRPSLIETIRSIAAQPQPVRQLWRGTFASVLRTSVGSALYFTTLNKMRTGIARRTTTLPSAHTPPGGGPPTASSSSSSSSVLPRLSPLQNLLTGAVARASVGFATMPLTVLKVRFESSLPAYTATYTQGLWHAARSIWRREGVRGFWKGSGATAIRDAPYAGLYVLFYESCKRALAVPASASAASSDGAGRAAPALLTARASAGVNFASSLLAAGTATLITNPPDAIKTRLQLQPDKYRNTLQALRVMLADRGAGGWRALFDGVGLRMARKGLSSALAWTVYESLIARAEVALLTP